MSPGQTRQGEKADFPATRLHSFSSLLSGEAADDEVKKTVNENRTATGARRLLP